uniref:Uncharacterized protein n=1 Tax=Glossina morsitans morsitans TaxID=37546 RepID=A0A1B0G6K6_GLOMM
HEKEKLEEELRQLVKAKEQSRSELEEKVNELKIKYSSEKGTLEQERIILEQELLRAEDELRKVINERNKLKERLDKLQEERAKLQAAKEKRDELKREEEKKHNLLKIQIEVIECIKEGMENALRAIKNVAQKSTVGEMQAQLRRKEVDQLRVIREKEEKLGSLQQQELSMQEELTKVTKAKRELRDKLNDLNIKINSMAANYEDVEELEYKRQEVRTDELKDTDKSTRQRLEKSCKEQQQLLDQIQRTYLDYIRDQLRNFEPEEFSTFRQQDEDLTRRSNKSIGVTIKINLTNQNSNLQQNKLMVKFNELSKQMKENDLLGLQIQLLGKEIKELEKNLNEFYELKRNQNINKQRFGKKAEKKQTNIELMEKRLLTVFAKEKKNLEEYLKLLEKLKQEQKFRLEKQLNSFENRRPATDLFVLIDEAEQRVKQLQQISNMLSIDSTTANERLRKQE